MNKESLNIIIISSQNMIADIERILTHVKSFIMQEEMDVFPWFISQILQQKERGETLLEALNDLFKKCCANDLDTIELTKVIHKLEKLMIDLYKDLYQEVDMSILK